MPSVLKSSPIYAAFFNGGPVNVGHLEAKVILFSTPCSMSCCIVGSSDWLDPLRLLRLGCDACIHCRSQSFRVHQWFTLQGLGVQSSSLTSHPGRSQGMTAVRCRATSDTVRALQHQSECCFIAGQSLSRVKVTFT